MYYEEKFIDGRVFFRTSPHSDFEQMSESRVAELYWAEKECTTYLMGQIAKLEEEAEELRYEAIDAASRAEAYGEES